MKNLVVLALCLLSLPSLAEPFATLSGNQSVLEGSSHTYSIQWSIWTPDHNNYATVSCWAENGTVVSCNGSQVTVQWHSRPDTQDFVGGISVYEDFNGQVGDLTVDVRNTTPSPSRFCPGLLGPPSVAVDFGSGPNPGPALPAGSTTYTYNASCAIFPDQYTRTNSSVGCRELWHGIPQDHTPNDVNGYFLMVDADDRRGEFYRTTVNGLNPVLPQEFSAWVGNLVNVNSTQYEEPRVRFEISSGGQVIGTSGDILVPFSSPFQWQRVGFTFDLPAGVTSAQVAVVSRNLGSNGNDMVIDDIAFAPCYPPPVASFQTGTVVPRAHVCENGSVNLYSWWPAINPFSSAVYQWQRSANNGATWTDIPGATSVSASYTESTPGIYQYRVKTYDTLNPAQILYSNPISYHVTRMVVAAKEHKLYSCNGAATSGVLEPSFTLQYADPSFAYNYAFNWAPATYLSSATARNPTITLPALGVSAPPASGPANPPINRYYSLTVTETNLGCSASNTQTVAQYNPRMVVTPNAFSPNGDNLNDLFRPLGLDDHPGATFSVFNRWGTRVYYADAAPYAWDGTYQGQPQPIEGYAWMIVPSICPANISTTSGSVTLVR